MSHINFDFLIEIKFDCSVHSCNKRQELYNEVNNYIFDIIFPQCLYMV